MEVFSATLCNLLQVGPGADEAQTRAVAEEKAALAMIFFLLHTEIVCTDRESYSNQIFYRTVLETLPPVLQVLVLQ